MKIGATQNEGREGQNERDVGCVLNETITKRTDAHPVPGFSIRGAWPHGTNRANGSSLPLVLIERIAHVRGGGCWKSPLRHAFGMTPPPKGEARLGSPFGGAGTAPAVTERAARQRFHTAHVQGPLASCPFR